MTLGSVSDPAAAAWFAKLLHPFGQDMGSVIPAGYGAYARVLHPAYRDSRRQPVRWHEIAAANNRTMHSEVQFGNIAGTWGAQSPQPHVWSEPPRVGTLPIEVARVLVNILRLRTRTADTCWFAVWAGYGAMPARRGPLLELPDREYYVVPGAIESALRSVTVVDWAYQSANMWWPDDRSWFVSTEVDFAWTYVGGSSEVIEEILAHREIEALPARLSDRFTWDSDSLNPSPGPPWS